MAEASDARRHFAVRFPETSYEEPKVFFRGYIANRTELAALFGRPDIGDGGLIALAYRKWDAMFPRHLLGEFFVVVCDPQRKRLVAARDSIGLRPGYYALARDAVVVGSNVEQLVRQLGNLPLSASYLSELLVQGLSHAQATAYDPIKLIPAGEALIFDGRLRFETFWSLLDAPEPDRETVKSLPEVFRQLLGEAVSGSLGRQTAVELSGGLDSTSIFSLAARASGFAAAISFVYSRSTTSDETNWIELALRQYPTKWVAIDEDAYTPFSIIPQDLPEPTRLISMWSSYLRYREAVKEIGADVVLSGFGGDQVMGGDISIPIHAAEPPLWSVETYRRLRSWQRARGSLRPLRFYLDEGVSKPRARWRAGEATTGEINGAVIPWISPGAIERNPWGLKMPAPPQRADNLGDQFYWEAIWRVSHSVAQFWNQMDLDFDIRHPMLCRPLVELMFRLPWRYKLSAVEDRVLQRLSLRGIIPEGIRTRRDKKGPDEAFKRGLSQSTLTIRKLKDRTVLADHGFVELRPWREAIDRAAIGAAPPQGQFVSAVILELWLQSRGEVPGIV